MVDHPGTAPGCILLAKQAITLCNPVAHFKDELYPGSASLRALPF